MIDEPLPLRLDGKKLRPPRTQEGGVERPTWSDYRPKTPKDCDHCVQVAYESAMSGDSYVGLRQARRKRRQDGKALHLCGEHAAIQFQADAETFRGVAPKRKTRGGQRYVA